MCHATVGPENPAISAIAEDFQTLDLGNGPVFASVFRPLGAPRGCVLIGTDMFGRSPYYRALGRRLAAEGYVAVVPELFSGLWPVAEGDERGGIARLMALDRTMAVANLAALIARTRADFPGLGIAVMGFCVGGSLALTLAAQVPYEAAILFYPTIDRRAPTKLSPYVPLDQLSAVQAPILAFWGDADPFVASASIAEADKALTGAAKPHEFVVYPGLGHAFLTFDPQDADYAPSADAWARALSCLSQTLKPGVNA